MIKSRSNITIKDYSDGKSIVYNLLSNKIIKVKKNLLEDEITKLGLDYFDVLCKHRFIYFDKDTEDNSLRDYYYNHTLSDNELNVMLLLTNECNFRCVYCFERSQIQEKTTNFLNMTNIELIKNYIESYMKKFAIKKLNITFYGGEPLLECEKMTILADYFYNSLGSDFQFNIITNGSLLSEQLIQNLKLKNLNGIKVTIDGARKIHNLRRPMMNGDSFSSIVSNLIEIKSIVPIKINIVIDAQNFQFIEDVIPTLKKIMSDKDEVQVNTTRNINMTIDERAQFICAASELLKNDGVKMSNAFCSYDGRICFGKKSNHVVINTDGRLYKCPSLVGLSNTSIGSIYDEVSQIDYNNKYIDSCIECMYFTICNGGCISDNLVNNSLLCQKKYFDLISKNLLPIYLGI